MSTRNWVWLIRDSDGIKVLNQADKPEPELYYPLELDEDQVERLLEGDRSVLAEFRNWDDLDTYDALEVCNGVFDALFPKFPGADGVYKVEISTKPTRSAGAVRVFFTRDDSYGGAKLWRDEPYNTNQDDETPSWSGRDSADVPDWFIPIARLKAPKAKAQQLYMSLKVLPEAKPARKSARR